MLAGVPASKDGYRYRVIPLRPDQWRTTPTLNAGMVINNVSSGRLRAGVARMWAVPRPYVDPSSRYRTMTDKPGSAKWIIPEFHAYAPGKILADLLQQEYGK